MKERLRKLEKRVSKLEKENRELRKSMLRDKKDQWKMIHELYEKV